MHNVSGDDKRLDKMKADKEGREAWGQRGLSYGMSRQDP